jgi:serine/threonine protein phosphatase PrpC
VLITTDGVHDHLEPDRLSALVRQHIGEPQALVDCLVTAALPDADGNRDDALALVLPRAADHEPAGAAR